MKYKIIIAASGMTSAASQIVLPFVVNAVFKERGYFAVGGEYGLVVLSLVSMVICLKSIIKMYEKRCLRYKAHIKAGRKTIHELTNLKPKTNGIIKKILKKAG